MFRRLTIAVTVAAYLLTNVVPLPLAAQGNHHGNKIKEEAQLDDIPGIDIDGNLTNADELLGDMLVKASINTNTGKTRATGKGVTGNESGKRQKYVNEDEIEGYAIFVLILMMSPFGYTFEEAVRALFAVKANGKATLKVSANAVQQ